MKLIKIYALLMLICFIIGFVFLGLAPQEEKIDLCNNEGGGKIIGSECIYEEIIFNSDEFILSMFFFILTLIFELLFIKLIVRV